MKNEDLYHGMVVKCISSPYWNRHIKPGMIGKVFSSKDTYNNCKFGIKWNGKINTKNNYTSANIDTKEGNYYISTNRNCLTQVIYGGKV